MHWIVPKLNYQHHPSRKHPDLPSLCFMSVHPSRTVRPTATRVPIRQIQFAVTLISSEGRLFHSDPTLLPDLHHNVSWGNTAANLLIVSTELRCTCWFVPAGCWLRSLINKYVNRIIIIIIITIVIILGIIFMRGIYNYIPEISHVFRVYRVAALLYLQLVLFARGICLYF